MNRRIPKNFDSDRGLSVRIETLGVRHGEIRVILKVVDVVFFLFIVVKIVVEVIVVVEVVIVIVDGS